MQWTAESPDTLSKASGAVGGECTVLQWHYHDRRRNGNGVAMQPAEEGE